VVAGFGAVLAVREFRVLWLALAQSRIDDETGRCEAQQIFRPPWLERLRPAPPD
jgi:hypothetical protein